MGYRVFYTMGKRDAKVGRFAGGLLLLIKKYLAPQRVVTKSLAGVGEVCMVSTK
jgi:hypothetical protein